MSRSHQLSRTVCVLLAAVALAVFSLAVHLSAVSAQPRPPDRAQIYSDAGFRGPFQGSVISRAMHEEAVRQTTTVLTHRQFRIDLDWGLPQ